MSGDDRRRACAVCARPLSIVLLAGQPINWRHMLPVDDDHVAVPVGLDEVQLVRRCDFCSHDVPRTWLLPALDFEMPLPPGMAGPPTYSTGGGWGCCEGCLPYVQKHDWPALLRHLRKHGRFRIRREGEVWMLKAYARLERAVIGPPVLLE